jgi:hypothetical protein
MVSGHRAFQRETSADTMSAVLNAEAPAASAAPREVDRLIATWPRCTPGWGEELDPLRDDARFEQVMRRIDGMIAETRRKAGLQSR